MSRSRMFEGDEGVRNGVSTGGVTWEDSKGLPSFEVCSCPILFQYYVPSTALHLHWW